MRGGPQDREWVWGRVAGVRATAASEARWIQVLDGRGALSGEVGDRRPAGADQLAQRGDHGDRAGRAAAAPRRRQAHGRDPGQRRAPRARAVRHDDLSARGEVAHRGADRQHPDRLSQLARGLRAPVAERLRCVGESSCVREPAGPRPQGKAFPLSSSSCIGGNCGRMLPHRTAHEPIERAFELRHPLAQTDDVTMQGAHITLQPYQHHEPGHRYRHHRYADTQDRAELGSHASILPRAKLR